MARRSRGPAARAGRRTARAKGRGGLSLLHVVLVVVAVLAVAGLALLPGRRPAAPPDRGVPGVEEPEAGAPGRAQGATPSRPRPEPEPARVATPAGAAPGRAAAAQDDASRTAGQLPEPASKASAAAGMAAAPAAPPSRPAGDVGDLAPSGRPTGGGRPRVAVVLDDCGQRLDLLQRAARIRQPLTFAVIPHLPHSRASAEAAFAAGHEVIVHQPMEPESGEENPGEGVLVSGMSRARVAKTLKESLADVPHAVGMNNHMGSRATADPALMDAVLGAWAEVARRRPLYFLDSRTSAQTVAWEAARRHGLRTGQRDVFLDNDLAPSAILAQVGLLVDRARQNGQAIGIGHLKPETLAVLEAELPRIDAMHVDVVFLGDLMR